MALPWQTQNSTFVPPAPYSATTFNSGVAPWKAPTYNGGFASQADLDAFNKAISNEGTISSGEQRIGDANYGKGMVYDPVQRSNYYNAWKWGVDNGILKQDRGNDSIGSFFGDVAKFYATNPVILGAITGGSLAAAGVGGTSAALPTALGGASALTADQQLAQSIAGLSATGPADTAAALNLGEASALGTGAAAGAEGSGGTAAASGLGGASGTVGQLFGDTATGIAASGLAGEATSSAVPALASSGGLPASVVGTAAQLPAGMGPIGDVASGAGATNTAYDFPALNSALTQPAGTSTVGSTLGKIASGAGNYLLKNPTLPLAAAGLATQLLRKPGIPQEGNLNTQYNTQEAQGQADIAAARAGTISPSQQAQIDKFTKDSDAALKQFFANSGQGVDSTSYLQKKQDLDQTALAMRQGYVDQLFSQGLQELGLADSAQAQLIQLRLQREQQTSDAMNSFMMTLGLMGAFSGSRANA